MLQAVTAGKWLLVEGLDAALPEVTASLVPLLESRRLHLSHRGQTIEAAPGFQFLATITTTTTTTPGALSRVNTTLSLRSQLLWHGASVTPATCARLDSHGTPDCSSTDGCTLP